MSQKMPLVVVLASALVAAGCTGESDPSGKNSVEESLVPPSAVTIPGVAPGSTVDAALEVTQFGATSCTGSFRTIELDHVVAVRQPETQFDANGAGVAIDDLDGDGRPDIVLGNLDGPVRVFWNDGEMSFSEETLLSGRARAVQTVDVDGDRDLDVVLAPGFGAPLVLVNDLADGESSAGGRPSFRISALPGVTAPAYSMAWLDPDADGDLDAVVASYDMEFGQVVGGEFINDAENGAWYLEQDGEGWTSTQLSPTTNALALTTVDVDADGDDDLIIGNDFGVPDEIQLWNDGWTPANDLFPVTAANTMSFDIGDVDADGSDELYATDMAPFGESNKEFWSAMAESEHDPPGPQLVENVLLDLGGADFENDAPDRGVEATGWSWSGRLADLDHDRDLDLYVANGMHPSPLFPVFPDAELREANLAFENVDGDFVTADDWGLGSMAGTRGLAFGDLDGDGDLDIVASTVESPALIFVNEVCEGESVIVEPRSTTGNTFAVGARVVVVTEQARMERQIRSGAGYLASDEAIAHFGLGGETIRWIEVHWPDGEVTVLDAPERARLRVMRES